MFYLFFLVLIISIKADTEVINVNTYSAIYNHIQSYIINNTVDTNDILFVTDIDNVIMTYDTDVGTDQWNNWQFDMIVKYNKTAITNSFTDFIDILSKIYTYKQHKLCENNIPQIISNIRNMGINTMALTSRGIPLIADTISELIYHNIYFNNSFIMDVVIDNAKFIDNIYFTSGKNKGYMLSLLLSRNIMTLPKKIFFVDDHPKHVHSVVNVFNNTQIDITGFIYNHELIRVVDFHNSSKIHAINEWFDIQKILKLY